MADFSQNSKILFFEFMLLIFSIQNCLPKNIFIAFFVFHNRLFNFWKKNLKKPITQWKKIISKNKKISFLPSYITSVHAKIRFLSQKVWAVDEGQTNLRQDRPKAEALWNFIIQIFFHRRSNSIKSGIGNCKFIYKKKQEINSFCNFQAI